jgi:signal transduction histidine kinase
LRFLFVEKSVSDAVKAVLALHQSGLVVVGHTVTTRNDLVQALNAGPWSVVIAGGELDGFSIREALHIVRERDEDMPFILLSAADDERAIELLREGVNDHVAKSNLLRLAPAARRAILEAETRRERNHLAGELRRLQTDDLTSLGHMAATIAHRFNNVLMGISSSVEVLRRKPEEIEKAVDQIGLAVSLGKAFTHDILRYTRPHEPKRVAMAVEPWLRNVVREARLMLAPTYAIDLDIDDGSLSIEADAKQLHQVLMQVVTNASNAMPDGGTIRVAMRPEPRTASFAFGPIEYPERFAHLIVRDEGCGMTQETLGQIFEPLFTTKKNGTGLGLAVTHQVVHRHGGEIFVESEPGVGTTFHIFLPLAEIAPPVIVSPEPGGELADDSAAPSNKEDR